MEAAARRDVQATMDRMVAGYVGSDVEMIMSCYEPRAAYALEAGEVAAGTEDLRRLVDKMLTVNPQFRFVSEEIVIVDDIAVHISAYDVERPGGSVHRGLSVAVLRRQTTGEWLITIDHPSAQRLM